MNTLHFPTKFRPSPNLAIIILDSFVVSFLTSISQQLVPLSPPSFTPNLIIVIVFATTSLSLKTRKSCQLPCFHWLKITERIGYKLLSLTYKILTTTQLPYLHNLITVQPPRSICSSSLVTLAGPQTSSSFLLVCLTLSVESTPYSLSTLYQSLYLWFAFYCSFRIFFLCCLVSPVSLSITPSLFHSRLKPTSFRNPSNHRLSSGLRADSADFMTGPFLLSISVFVTVFFHYSFCFLGSVRELKLATCQLLDARKYNLSYRIVYCYF